MQGFSLGSGIAYAAVCISGAAIIIFQMVFNAPWFAYIFPSLMIIAGTAGIESRTVKVYDSFKEINKDESTDTF